MGEVKMGSDRQAAVLEGVYKSIARQIEELRQEIKQEFKYSSGQSTIGHEEVAGALEKGLADILAELRYLSHQNSSIYEVSKTERTELQEAVTAEVKSCADDMMKTLTEQLDSRLEALTEKLMAAIDYDEIASRMADQLSAYFVGDDYEDVEEVEDLEEEGKPEAETPAKESEEGDAVCEETSDASEEVPEAVGEESEEELLGEVEIDYDLLAEKIASMMPETDYDSLVDKVVAALPQLDQDALVDKVVAATQSDNHAIADTVVEALPLTDYDLISEKVTAALEEAALHLSDETMEKLAARVAVILQGEPEETAGESEEAPEEATTEAEAAVEAAEPVPEEPLAVVLTEDAVEKVAARATELWLAKQQEQEEAKAAAAAEAEAAEEAEPVPEEPKEVLLTEEAIEKVAARATELWLAKQQEQEEAKAAAAAEAEAEALAEEPVPEEPKEVLLTEEAIEKVAARAAEILLAKQQAQEAAEAATAAEAEAAEKPAPEPAPAEEIGDDIVERVAARVAEMLRADASDIERIVSESVPTEEPEPLPEEPTAPIEEEMAIAAVPAEEPAPAPVPAPKATVVVVPTEVADDKMIRYKRSFVAKIIGSDEDVKTYYSDLKNAILAYSKVRSQINWTNDRFYIGNDSIIKIGVRGRTLCLYLALDPSEFPETVYHQKFAGDTKMYELTPMMVKIKSKVAVKRGIRLIDLLMERNGLTKDEREPVDYAAQYFFRTDEELLAEGLIKTAIVDKSDLDF